MTQSVTAAELLTRGTFEFACVSDEGRVFHHERPADDASGVGPVGSWWVAEAGDEAPKAAHCIILTESKADCEYAAKLMTHGMPVTAQ